MRGTVLFATDEETREYLEGLVDQRVEPQTTWTEAATNGALAHGR